MNKKITETYIPKLFDILHSNMSIIATTGNSYEEDCKEWSENIVKNLNNDKRQIILMQMDDDLIGFFMYSVANNIFKMEEIQIQHEYHGKQNIFRLLYSYLFSVLPIYLETIDAYANKKNTKSQNILQHLGLKIIDENKSNFHYQGKYDDLLQWFNSTI
jgi:hypothetical protein